MKVSENKRIEVTSTGPNKRAYSANGAARNINNYVEKKSPITEANNPILSALEALPCLDIG